MSKQKVIVLAVRDQGLTVAAAARRYGVSRRWVHELLRREAEGGIDAARAHAGKHLLMLIHDTEVTISDTTTGEIIRELTIDPSRDYQARQRKTPRSEDRGVTDDPTHP
ncbi:helix-turn-helix domain-containing protein [Arthrobacter sp. MA-N2]|uniref:helix-turn-helix domain-containing protein n=1 Tax=Arthrobacter sp. MA-N2 TaxID=1101188 RepID=UPI00048742A3|nr:helix-turn-helix domain-containing protein [Arthrobacter sp. MA-N2]